MYSLLLRLLPRERREAHGDEMSRVFAELLAATRRERGAVGVAGLWFVEIAGLARFSVRERIGTAFGELGWALRGIRGRRWTAALSVGLISVAVAANSVLFSVADSLVFHRLPYRDADQLVAIQNKDSMYPTSRMSANLIDEWAANRDIIAGVGAYLDKVVFLQGEGAADTIGTADVTPGLIELLGATPRWGRSLTKEDTALSDVDVVVISEELARARFGEPALALGQTMETTSFPLRVVGVMPATFRFPYGGIRIWRALDPRGELVRGFAGLGTIVRLAPGLTPAAAEGIIAQRSSGVAAASGMSQPYLGTVTPLDIARSPDEQRKLFLVLLAAAGCLLLISCANVASFELAAAMGHARTYGIQLALGASKGTLARVALLEGALLNMTAIGLAYWLVSAGVEALKTYLPERLGMNALNPIDVDNRTMLFMAAATMACWLLASLPPVLYAARASVANLIQSDVRTQSASSGGVRMRRLLTVGQVAVAVPLLVGTLLYTRSYISMLRVEKGFDSRALASLDFTIPPQMSSQVPFVRQDLVARLKAIPGVVAVMADRPPNGANTPFGMKEFELDNTVLRNVDLRIAQKPVSWNYFRVLGIPLRAGRSFQPDEPVTRAIVDEEFARRFWPNGAIGHTFRGGWFRRVYEIVGVAGHVRTDRVRPRGQGREPFLFYTPEEPVNPVQAPPAAPAARKAATNSLYAFIVITAKLDSPARADEFFRAARAMSPQFKMEGTLVDDAYARYEEDTLLVTRVVSSFGIFAFVVSIVGIYGVMAFIAAGRRREIGIRMTLGADRAAISRLVIGASLRMALIGAAVGCLAALASSRWVASQLFGVTPTDPATYVLVALGILLTTVLATWHPARLASRVDPATTLRTE